MRIREVTKITFLACLVTIVIIPMLAWLFLKRDLQGVAGFVAAASAPMGVLTGAMAASKINKNKHQGDS